TYADCETLAGRTPGIGPPLRADPLSIGGKAGRRPAGIARPGPSWPCCHPCGTGRPAPVRRAGGSNPRTPGEAVIRGKNPGFFAEVSPASPYIPRCVLAGFKISLFHGRCLSPLFIRSRIGFILLLHPSPAPSCRT